MPRRLIVYLSMTSYRNHKLIDSSLFPETAIGESFSSKFDRSKCDVENATRTRRAIKRLGEISKTLQRSKRIFDGPRVSLTDIRNNGLAERPVRSTFGRDTTRSCRVTRFTRRVLRSDGSLPALFLPSYVVKACQLNYRRPPRTSVVPWTDTATRGPLVASPRHYASDAAIDVAGFRDEHRVRFECLLLLRLLGSRRVN